jgi:hypothetical protein
MMHLYLNDWSLIGVGNLSTQWGKVDRWFELMKHLSATYGISQIGGPKDFWSLEICGYALNRCFVPTDTMLENDKKQLLQNLSTYIRKADVDENTIKIYSNSVGVPESVCLGKAYELNSSVVSFTFDQTYENREVSGVIKQNGKNDQSCSITNLYDKESIDVVLLVPRRKSEQYKASENPMWNQEMMTKYCDSIGHKSDRKSNNEGEKIAYLKLHGRILAEMNGWRYDENKTKLNHTDEHQRIIFRSVNFKSDNCYLSIDFEKEDFHFELLDHRGRHLREIDWHGNTTGDADSGHDIKMKR